MIRDHKTAPPMKKKKKSVDVPKPIPGVFPDAGGRHLYQKWTDGSIRRVRGIHG